MIIGDNLIYEKLYLRYLRYLLSTTIAGVQRTVPGTCAHAHAHERIRTTSKEDFADSNLRTKTKWLCTSVCRRKLKFAEPKMCSNCPHLALRG